MGAVVECIAGNHAVSMWCTQHPLCYSALEPSSSCAAEIRATSSRVAAEDTKTDVRRIGYYTQLAVL